MSNDQASLTRDQRRSRRQHAVRSMTVAARDMRRDLALVKAHDPASEEDLAELARLRPRTRGDCVDGLRPCPFVGCKHHLYLEVAARGGLRFNFPDIEPEQLTDSCVLDLADLGGVRLEDVAQAINVTREGARQIEVHAVERAAKLAARRHLDVFLTHDHDDRHTGDL